MRTCISCRQRHASARRNGFCRRCDSTRSVRSIGPVSIQTHRHKTVLSRRFRFVHSMTAGVFWVMCAFRRFRLNPPDDIADLFVDSLVRQTLCSSANTYIYLTLDGGHFFGITLYINCMFALRLTIPLRCHSRHFVHVHLYPPFQ